MKSKDGKLLLILVVILSLFGLIMIYSASSIWANYKFNDPFKFVKAQGLFFLLGIFLIFFISIINT